MLLLKAHFIPIYDIATIIIAANMMSIEGDCRPLAVSQHDVEKRFLIYYSYLRLSTGLARAIFTTRKLTVKDAINRVIKADRTKTSGAISIR